MEVNGLKVILCSDAETPAGKGLNGGDIPSNICLFTLWDCNPSGGGQGLEWDQP